jgi:acyl-CoA oxidase
VHQIVVAQLLLPLKINSTELARHGSQTFILQIRDKTTHQPLEGIAVGDIGPKYGKQYSSRWSCWTAPSRDVL